MPIRRPRGRRALAPLTVLVTAALLAALAYPAAAAPPPGERTPTAPGPLAIALSLVAFVLVPGGLFAALVGGVALAASRFTDRLTAIRSVAGPAVAVVGLVAAVLPLGGLSVFGGTAGAAQVGFGLALAAVGLALAVPTVRTRATYRTLVGGAVGGALLAVALTFAVGSTTGGLTTAVVSQLPYGLAFFALLPAGYASARGDVRLAIVTATVPFAAAPAALALATRTTAVGLGLLLALTGLFAAVAIAVVGSPLFLAGCSLATRDDVGSTV